MGWPKLGGKMQAIILFIILILQTSLAVAGNSRVVVADEFKNSDLTKTWMPPATSTTLIGTDTNDILTNKSIDGLTNTLTNIPGSAITNSSIDLTTKVTGVLPVANGGTGYSTGFTFSSPLVNTLGTISIPPATSLANGYLTSTDWSTFNSKQNALTFGNLSGGGSDGISVSGGTGAVIGSGASISQTQSSALSNGYLSSTDWSTFNSKQAALTPGNISTSTTGVSVGSGTAATVGPNVTIDVQTASGSQPGLLSSTDWTTFNGKQDYITPGTTLQYWRGDKTWQTLSTSVVPEGTNLYFTDARVQLTAKNNTSAQYFKVSQSNGLDTNDCSILAPCKTIQAGINAANAVAAYYRQAIVLVEPSVGGTGYTEDITLSQQGVNLQCEQGFQASRACLLGGTITANLTGTSGGIYFIAAINDTYMDGFTVVKNTASPVLTFSGTQYQRLTLTNSYIQNPGSGNAISMTNSNASSKLIIYDGNVQNNSAVNPTVNMTGGNLWVYGSNSTFENNAANAVAITQSGGFFICNICNIGGQYNLTSNTATAQISNSFINSGTLSPIQLPATPNTGYVVVGNNLYTSSNTNTIAGAGVLIPSSGNFCGGTGCAIQNTVTVSYLSRLPEGVIKPSGLQVSGLTASQPVLTDANKNLVSGLIANGNMATMAQATIKGRASGAGTGSPQDLTGTQATAILDTFTSTLKGLAPSSGGGTSNFLRADGTWAAPAGTGVTSVSVATANGLAGTSSGGTTPQLTLSTTITGILQGNGTAISAASTTGTGSVVLANAPTISGAWGSPDSLQFNTGATVTPAVGKLFWDGFSTFDFGMTANVNQLVGQSQFYYIKADAAITKGQVIMFTGANGGSGILKGAPATGVTNGDYIMGIAAESIPLNGFGLVQSFGLIKNVDTSGYVDGDILYYDPTVTGGFTKTAPLAPNVKTVVAAVVNGGSPGGGSIYVRVTDGGDLNHLANVQTTSPTSGQLLKYDGTKWVNASVSSLSTETQETPSGTINNSNAAFTLAHTPLTNASVKLYQDGLILKQGTDYTITGTSITMTTAPNYGQTLYAVYNY